MDTLQTPAMAPRIPGYTPSRQLGRGGSSIVWLVTRDRDGARFAVKCMVASGDAEDYEQACAGMRREVGLYSRLKHEHLVAVHDLVELDRAAGGPLGIVMDYAAGGSLANLVAGRGRLRVGEAVTMLTPIAQALTYVHANGLVHGDVSPGNVLFTAEGMPLLADLGVAVRVGDPARRFEVGTTGFMDPTDGDTAGTGAEHRLRPERDVYSLAAVGWYALTGSAPEPVRLRPPLPLIVPDVPKGLAAALEAGLDPDPRLRPSAKELGLAIFRSAAPEPLDLSGAVHSSVIPELLTRREIREQRSQSLRRLSMVLGGPAFRRRIGGRQRIAGRLALTMAGGALICAGALAVWHHNPESTESQRPVPSSSDVDSGQIPETSMSSNLSEALAQGLASDDPVVAVRALSAVRDLALSQGRPDLFTVVNKPGSPAQVADEQLENQLRESGTVFTGLVTTLAEVSAEGSSRAGHALIAVTATTSAFEERDAADRVVRTQAEGTPQRLSLQLIRSDGRWQVSEIMAPTG